MWTYAHLSAHEAWLRSGYPEAPFNLGSHAANILYDGFRFMNGYGVTTTWGVRPAFHQIFDNLISFVLDFSLDKCSQKRRTATWLRSAEENPHVGLTVHWFTYTGAKGFNAGGGGSEQRIGNTRGVRPAIHQTFDNLISLVLNFF